jgi:hypothetical protein
MTSEPASPLRFVSTSTSSLPVLTGRGGRLRGEVLLEGDAARALETAEIRAKNVRLDSAAPLSLAPRGPQRAALTVSVDPLTPPGSYEAEIEIGGVTQPVTLVVVEDIGLTLSEREIIVIPGEERPHRITMRNTGNIPLAVSHAGPAELTVDRRRPTLLQRLGWLPLEPPDAPVVDGRASARAEPRDDGEDEDRPPDEPPTITARLKEPVLVGPGETVVGDWAVTVEGTLDPGVRYRGVAPLYTTDIGFVVTPAQEGPPPPPPRARRRPRKKETP